MNDKQGEYVLVYEYDMPIGYINEPIWSDFLIENLQIENQEQIQIEVPGTQLSLTTTQHASINNPFLWVKPSTFRNYGTHILNLFKLRCALIVLYDPQTDLKWGSYDAYCLSQRLETCRMVLSAISKPIFLIILDNQEEQRDWTQLIDSPCAVRPAQKQRYKIGEQSTLLDDLKSFLDSIAED